MYKMKRLHIYSILVVAFLIHMTVLNYIEIAGAKPDLILMCVIFFAIFLGPAIGFETGLVAGLAQDLLTFDYFWVNTFILASAGLAAAIVSDNLFRESRATQFLLVFLSVCLSSSLHFFIFSAVSKNSNFNFYGFFLNSVIPTAIYTTAVSIPVFIRFIDMFKLREQDEFL